MNSYRPPATAMRIGIVTPAPPHSRKGNRVTAVRWSRILGELGHDVAVIQEYSHQSFDLLIGLHARRSAKSVVLFKRRHPNRPVVIALTGTDLYGDIRTSIAAQQVLEMASRLVVLQPLGIQGLPHHLHWKTRVIFQSVRKPHMQVRPLKRVLEVCVMGHLRPVKDPFRTALAVRRLPSSSRIRITHLGVALSDGMARRAQAEMARNPRYRWLGELPRGEALRILARSRLLVLTSRLEGGANVVSEALAAGVPVVSSRIAGSIGILGSDYPGYFPVGNTHALTALLSRLENDPEFYRSLKERCRRLAHLTTPARERRTWKQLLRETARLPEPNHTGRLTCDLSRGSR